MRRAKYHFHLTGPARLLPTFNANRPLAGSCHAKKHLHDAAKGELSPPVPGNELLCNVVQIAGCGPTSKTSLPNCLDKRRFPAGREQAMCDSDDRLRGQTPSSFSTWAYTWGAGLWRFTLSTLKSRSKRLTMPPCSSWRACTSIRLFVRVNNRKPAARSLGNGSPARPDTADL